jgi:hypothetical protein
VCISAKAACPHSIPSGKTIGFCKIVEILQRNSPGSVELLLDIDAITLGMEVCQYCKHGASILCLWESVRVYGCNLGAMVPLRLHGS